MNNQICDIIFGIIFFHWTLQFSINSTVSIATGYWLYDLGFRVCILIGAKLMTAWLWNPPYSTDNRASFSIGEVAGM